MSIRCREILRLPSLNSMKVIGGAEGLDRNLRWIYVAECFEDIRQVADWLYGGELVFITGLGLKGDTAALADFIEKINAKYVAGLVVNVGPYIKSIPHEIGHLADRLSIPLFELPWESKLVEVTHDICSTIITKEKEEKSLGNLLENIIFSDSDLDENLTDRAAYYGYDLSGTCQAGILDIDGFAFFLKEKEITDEKAVMDIKTDYQRIVQEIFIKHNKRSLTMLRSDSVIFLARFDESGKRQLERIIDEIRQVVGKRLYGLTVSAGIGNCYTHLKDFRKSFKEADQALKIAKCSVEKNATCFYQDLGIYSLLLSIKDREVLENYYYDILGPVLEYDRLNETDLSNTLKVYLDESCSTANASEKLFIHRNTLKYRMQKIEELLSCSMKNLQDCVKYSIGFKIGQLLDSIWQQGSGRS